MPKRDNMTLANAEETLRGVMLKNGVVIVTGPARSGKTTLIQNTLAKTVRTYDLVTIPPVILRDEVGLGYLRRLVRVPPVDTRKTVVHISSTEMIDMGTLTEVVRVAARTRAVPLIIETTTPPHRLGKVRSYCEVVEVPRPDRYAHHNTNPTGHSSVSPPFRGDSDFTLMSRLFSGERDVDVSSVNTPWFIQGAMDMLLPYDRAVFLHYLSSMVRNGTTYLIPCLRLTGKGWVSYPYLLKKSSLKTREV